MIYLGADHGGFDLKEQIKQWLEKNNQPYEDCGAFVLNPADDYPTYGHVVAQKISQDAEHSRGILICRTGGGMAIVANRHLGIRAVDCHTVDEARYARSANDANLISLPADVLSQQDAENIVEVFLETPFSREERHLRRVRMIDA